VSSPEQDYKLLTHSLLHFSTIIMSREMMLGLLSVANTGDDILAVLDVIQSDTQSDNQGDAVSYVSGESVTFWVSSCFRGY